MIPSYPYPKAFRRGNIFRMKRALQKKEIRIVFLGGTNLYANIDYDAFYEMIKKELIEKIRYILLLENDDNCIDLMCYYLFYFYIIRH